MTNRILSWKINNGVYAYIYLPGQNTYLDKKYSDDSSIWQDIIKEVNSEEKYKTHYNKMIAEIKNKYGIVFDSDYKRYYNFNSSFGTNNIVVLSGKDGYNAIVDSDVAEDLNLIKAKLREIELLKNEINDIIEGKFDYYKEYVNTQTNSALEEVTRLISSVDDTFNNINDKIDNLEEIKNQISEDNKEILSYIEDKTSETIKEVNDKVDQINEDVNKKVTEINELKGELDTEFAELKGKLDGLEGSLTEVGQKIDENTGTIETFANWYDANASAATEVINYINASAAQISDVVTYVGVDESGSSLMTKVESKINGVSGTIIDSVYTEYSGVVTNITNSINSLSAIVETDLTRIDNISSSITNINTEMSALKGSVETSLTNVSGISGSVVSINETMNVISGFVETNLISVSGISGSVVSINETMDVLSGYVNTSLTSIDNISGSVTTVQQELSTTSGITNAVFNLVAKDNGDGTYDYSDNLGTFAHQSVSGFIQTAINSCITISEKVDALDGSMTEYIEKIDSATSATTMLMEHWDTIEGITTTVQHMSGDNKFESYVNQASSSITMGILEDGETVAGFFMNAISGDTEAQEYIFGITADKFVVDADMITNALSANTANIGGISIGNGGMSSTIEYIEYYELSAFTADIDIEFVYIKKDLFESMSDMYTNNNYNKLLVPNVYIKNSENNLIKSLDDFYYAEEFDGPYVVRYSNNIRICTYGFEDRPSESDIEVFQHVNYKLDSSGNITTNAIYVNDGVFNGEINARGEFSGELVNVNGNLNNANITKSNINDSSFNGNIELSSLHTLTALNASGDTYLNVLNSNISNNIVKYYSISTPNYNFAAGQSYRGTVKLTSFNCKYLDTITIPRITSCIQITNPIINENTSSNIKLSYKYNGQILTSTSGGVTSGLIQHSSISIPEYEYSVTGSGKFEIILEYMISVPNGIGGSSEGNVHVDEVNDKIKVESTSMPSSGTTISPNGFMAVSPNCEYGIWVSNSGLTVLINGQWQSLTLTSNESTSGGTSNIPATSGNTGGFTGGTILTGSVINPPFVKPV